MTQDPTLQPQIDAARAELDPAIVRLFPTAHPEDVEAEAAYQETQRDRLLAARLDRLDTVEATLQEESLDDEQHAAWIATINDMSEADQQVMGSLFMAAKSIAAVEGLTDDGYRVVMNCNEGAGQSVFHVHLHLPGGRHFKWPPG